MVTVYEIYLFTEYKIKENDKTLWISTAKKGRVVMLIRVFGFGFERQGIKNN